MQKAKVMWTSYSNNKAITGYGIESWKTDPMPEE